MGHKEIAAILTVLVLSVVPAFAQDPAAMKIKYKIIEVSQQEHQIVVRYYTDLITEQMLSTDTLDGKVRRARTDVAIDLPIPLPPNEEIHGLIQRQAQVDFFRKKEAIIKGEAGPDIEELRPIVGKEFVMEVEVPLLGARIQR